MGVAKEPITNGLWWTGNKAVPIKCGKCDYWHKQRPTVIRYIPEMDFLGDWERKHPGVEAGGWLLWGWHRKRGGGYEDWFRVAIDAEVRHWDSKAAGWHRDDNGRMRKGELPQ